MMTVSQTSKQHKILDSSICSQSVSQLLIIHVCYILTSLQAKDWSFFIMRWTVVENKAEQFMKIRTMADVINHKGNG